MIFIDDRNRKVNVPDDPQRIISMSPSITETLFRLGKGENIVDVTSYCMRPQKAREIKKIGSYGYARIDLIEKMEPDLILTVSGYQEKVAEQLSEKFPVFVISLPFSLFSVLDLIIKTGIVVNRVQEARLITNDLTNKILNLKRNQRKLKLYYEIDLGGPVTFGSLSYINHSFEFLGYETYGSQIRKEWFVPNFEDVRNFNPDIIIFERKMFSKLTRDFYMNEIRKRKWESIKAYRDDRIFITPSELDFFAHHGPSFIEEALPWAANLI